MDESTLEASVGTNVRYGRDLEFGTKKMASRPFLRRTVMEEQGELESIFKDPV